MHETVCNSKWLRTPLREGFRQLWLTATIAVNSWRSMPPNCEETQLRRERVFFWLFMLIAGGILWYLLVSKVHAASEEGAKADKQEQEQQRLALAQRSREIMAAQPRPVLPGDFQDSEQKRLSRSPEGSMANVDLATQEEPVESESEIEDSLAERQDAWEEWDPMLYTSIARSLTASLRITFCDGAGAVTTRDITVERYFADAKGGAMLAYCHLRKARRPFVFSRIREAIDRETGEVIDDLVGWLDRAYEVSPAGGRDRFLTSHADALLCLFFVAKADGTFHAKEKLVVREFCEAQGANDPLLLDQVVDWVKGQPRMSRVAYGIALRAVAEKHEAYRQSVVAAATRLAEATAGVHTEEAKALERMKRELKLV